MQQPSSAAEARATLQETLMHVSKAAAQEEAAVICAALAAVKGGSLDDGGGGVSSLDTGFRNSSCDFCGSG